MDALKHAHQNPAKIRPHIREQHVRADVALFGRSVHTMRRDSTIGALKYIYRSDGIPCAMPWNCLNSKCKRVRARANCFWAVRRQSAVLVSEASG